VIKKSLVLVFGLLVLASGCSKKEETPAASTAPGAAAALKPVPAVLPDVVAKVNGEDIKKVELELAIRTLEERNRASVPPDQRDTVYRQVLDRIVGFKLLVQEAKSRKTAPPPWEVDGKVDELKRQFPSEEQFQAMLKARGVTFEQLRAETADSVAVNTMLQTELGPKVKVNEADVKKFYDENKARFRQEDSVHASHILIRVDEKADVATKQKAKAQAEDILKQIKKGAAFADLAKKFSQDPGSAPNGGDLGFFTKGQMVPQFENAAFALQVGQTSAVVESPFGYHIIKVQETKPGRDLNYEEVKLQIGDYLKQQAQEKEAQAFIDTLKAKGKVTILI